MAPTGDYYGPLVVVAVIGMLLSLLLVLRVRKTYNFHYHLLLPRTIPQI